jgi:hypothetical protein
MPVVCQDPILLPPFGPGYGNRHNNRSQYYDNQYPLHIIAFPKPVCGNCGKGGHRLCSIKYAGQF